MRRPLQKRKAPAPQIRHFRGERRTQIIYAGRKIPFKVVQKRVDRLSKKWGDMTAQEYKYDYWLYTPEEVLGSHGQLSFEINKEDGRKTAYCKSIFVRDFYRNKGLATRLYQRFERIARAQGADKLTVVLVENIEIQAHILKKLGWTLEKSLPTQQTFSKKVYKKRKISIFAEIKLFQKN